MNARQTGFTLIELVMVIVILGILAASAIPKFVDVKSDARQAAVDGVAGSLGSASAINYAVRSMNVANGTAVDDCTDVSSALEGGLGSGFAVTPSTAIVGSTATCTLTKDSVTATFVAHKIP